jgi:hypothetical protein
VYVQRVVFTASLRYTERSFLWCLLCGVITILCPVTGRRFPGELCRFLLCFALFPGCASVTRAIATRSSRTHAKIDVFETLACRRELPMLPPSKVSRYRRDCQLYYRPANGVSVPRDYLMARHTPTELQIHVSGTTLIKRHPSVRPSVLTKHTETGGQPNGVVGGQRRQRGVVANGKTTM